MHMFLLPYNFPHILENILLSCFLQSIFLQNKVWNILQELTRIFPHYFLGGVKFSYFLTLPLAMLLLHALPLHIVFLHIHYIFVSYPSCAYFLLELKFECLLYHASKCNIYPVQSLCINWLHNVNPILLPVHDRTRNLGFCILPKCDACTCKIIGFTLCSQFMHSDCTGYILHLEAWYSRHSNFSSSRK